MSSPARSGRRWLLGIVAGGIAISYAGAAFVAAAALSSASGRVLSEPFAPGLELPFIEGWPLGTSLESEATEFSLGKGAFSAIDQELAAALKSRAEKFLAAYPAGRVEGENRWRGAFKGDPRTTGMPWKDLREVARDLTIYLDCLDFTGDRAGYERMLSAMFAFLRDTQAAFGGRPSLLGHIVFAAQERALTEQLMRHAWRSQQDEAGLGRILEILRDHRRSVLPFRQMLEEDRDLLPLCISLAKDSLVTETAFWRLPGVRSLMACFAGRVQTHVAQMRGVYYDPCIAALERPVDEAFQALSSEGARLSTDEGDNPGNLAFLLAPCALTARSFVWFAMPNIRVAFERELLRETRARGSAVALNLLLHVHRTGAPPSDLSVVAPMMKGSEAEDPFTGHPWHYERKGTDFVLAGVGEDQVGSGGRPSRHGVIWPPSLERATNADRTKPGTSAAH